MMSLTKRCLTLGLSLVLLCTACTADSDSQLNFDSSSAAPTDLNVGESRYKVVAKPEPYKPPQPAPLSLDSEYALTATTPFTTTTSGFRPTAPPSARPKTTTKKAKKTHKKVRKVKKRRRKNRKNKALPFPQRSRSRQP